MKSKKYWTDKQKQILLKYIESKPPGLFSYKELSRLIGRSVNGIQCYMRLHGLIKFRRKHFKDVKYCHGCKKVLNKSEFTVRGHRCRLCVKQYYKNNPEKYKRYRENRRANVKKRLHDLCVHKKYKEIHKEKMLFLGAKKRAEKYKLPFNIKESDIVIPAKCPLLGISFRYDGTMNNRDASPSIDRINPAKGYIKGNVWIISFRANRIKNDASLEELVLIGSKAKKILWEA